VVTSSDRVLHACPLRSDLQLALLQLLCGRLQGQGRRDMVWFRQKRTRWDRRVNFCHIFADFLYGWALLCVCCWQLF